MIFSLLFFTVLNSIVIHTAVCLQILQKIYLSATTASSIIVIIQRYTDSLRGGGFWEYRISAASSLQRLYVPCILFTVYYMYRVYMSKMGR